MINVAILGAGFMGSAHAANYRALWALAWFLLVYHCGPGRLLASCLPRPPVAWSASVVHTISVEGRRRSAIEGILYLWDIPFRGIYPASRAAGCCGHCPHGRPVAPAVLPRAGGS